MPSPHTPGAAPAVGVGTALAHDRTCSAIAAAEIPGNPTLSGSEAQRRARTRFDAGSVIVDIRSADSVDIRSADDLSRAGTTAPVVVEIDTARLRGVVSSRGQIGADALLAELVHDAVTSPRHPTDRATDNDIVTGEMWATEGTRTTNRVGRCTVSVSTWHDGDVTVLAVDTTGLDSYTAHALPDLLDQVLHGWEDTARAQFQRLSTPQHRGSDHSSTAAVFCPPTAV